MPLISLKVAPEMLERIDAEAKSKGMTRTALLLHRWMETDLQRVERSYSSGSQRPAHDPTCRCYTCKPPK